MRLCIYCNEPADTRDHVIPVSYTHNTRRFRGTYYVRACNECNTTLSDHIFITVSERADYLIRAYRKKYRKELKAVYWTEEELSDMSAQFQRSIRARQRETARARKRMDWLAVVATLGEEAEAFNDADYVEHAKTRKELHDQHTYDPDPRLN